MKTPPKAPNLSPSDAPLDERALLAAARAALEHAHSPYSGVRVGAALLDTAGRVHAGCNVENASYGLTICAERNALARAVADGSAEFVAIAIATNRASCLAPCGACRQVLSEFAPNLRVLSVGTGAACESWSLTELLPMAFRPSDLH
ncbi:MAG: cytidine deaminase [bacterium]|jgi:cytidine deaminase|nr:cytidine deaminase [Planctomycetota bacterium]HIL52717.1 cytidine deaminase [Planctomycetota bacterium]